MNLIGRSSAVSELPCLLFLPSVRAILNQTVAGEALALADRIPGTVASPAPPVEAEQMSRAMETPNAVGHSHLRKETPGCPRVPRSPLTRRGMERKPTDLTEEMTNGEIDMARAAQELDRGTQTPMFQTMATLPIVRGTRVPILTGVQTIDMITAGNQEGEVVVPVTGMGVAASHPTSACILLGDEILMMNRNEKRSCHDFCLVKMKTMVTIYIPTALCRTQDQDSHVY